MSSQCDWIVKLPRKTGGMGEKVLDINDGIVIEHPNGGRFSVCVGVSGLIVNCDKGGTVHVTGAGGVVVRR